jgi:hypothetical protein
MDWINGFIGTFFNYSSQSVTAQDWLHSLLDYERLLFCVTDLVLIYETVTSSASVVRWLTLHSWTITLLRLTRSSRRVESSRVESYVTSDVQSASLSWNREHIWGLGPYFYYCQTFAGLLMWGAPSDERTGRSFTPAAGPRQRSHSPVRVPQGSWLCFTASDSGLPQPEELGHPYLYPSTTTWPSYAPGTGFPFRRLIRHSELRWRYYNRPPQGITSNYHMDGASKSADTAYDHAVIIFQHSSKLFIMYLVKSTEKLNETYSIHIS